MIRGNVRAGYIEDRYGVLKERWVCRQRQENEAVGYEH